MNCERQLSHSRELFRLITNATARCVSDLFKEIYPNVQSTSFIQIMSQGVKKNYFRRLTMLFFLFAFQAPVTVNIVLKDQSCLPFMTDVGMHILYYCKHCTHYSQQLLSVIEHIKQCTKKHTEGEFCISVQ